MAEQMILPGGKDDRRVELIMQDDDGDVIVGNVRVPTVSPNKRMPITFLLHLKEVSDEAQRRIARRYGGEYDTVFCFGANSIQGKISQPQFGMGADNFNGFSLPTEMNTYSFTVHPK